MSLMNEALKAAAAECDRYRAALQYIADIEPGSRGAYSKFVDAQRRAKEVLAQNGEGSR